MESIPVESNQAYGVLSQQTFNQQESGDGALQRYMYDYPMTEAEIQVGLSAHTIATGIDDLLLSGYK